MTDRRLHRFGVLAAASMFALAVSAGTVYAAGSADPPQPRTNEPKSPPPKGKTTKKKQKTSEQEQQEFRDGYRNAYALVQAGQYEAAFVAFKALGQDELPDVANYLGYTSRKLGRY